MLTVPFFLIFIAHIYTCYDKYYFFESLQFKEYTLYNYYIRLQVPFIIKQRNKILTHSKIRCLLTNSKEIQGNSHFR